MVYLVAKTKSSTLICLERFLYLTICLFVLWGEEKTGLTGKITDFLTERRHYDADNLGRAPSKKHPW